MSALPLTEPMVVRGRIDADGRLVSAEAPLEGLHLRAGGEKGGALAVPQIAALARLSRRLGIVISRGVIAADEDTDLDLWVRALPDDDGVALEIGGWSRRPAYAPSPALSTVREADFLRAAADWMWETDESLHFTALSHAAAAAVGKVPSELVGEQLTMLFRFLEAEDGSLPILTALAEHRRFEGQLAELRTATCGRYRLGGVPLIDGNGRFAGFRGSATSLRAELPDIPAKDPAPPPP
ncbi:MAG TPA: PAS domain-containing sensor histidine kinase, partial [Allosphingosinicella sp.]